MNKNFRVIWNHTLGNYIVASELARGKIKSATTSSHRIVNCSAVTGALLVAAVAAIVSQPTVAAPVYGEHASGAGNMLNIADKDITTAGVTAHGLFIEKGASASSRNVNFTTGGKGAFAVYVNGVGSAIDISGGSLSTSGANGHGLVAGNYGQLMASDITLDVNGYGLYANQANLKAKNIAVKAKGFGINVLGNATKVDIIDSDVSVAGNGAYAAVADKEAKLTSTNVHYRTSGEKSYGGWVSSGSQLNLSGGSITATGVNSYGIFAKPGSEVNVKDLNIDVAGTGINASNANFKASDLNINATGYGMQLLNIVTDLNNLKINAGASGVSVKGDKSQINITNSEISGAQYVGGAIYVTGKGAKVTVSDSTLISTGKGSAGLTNSYSSFTEANNVNILIKEGGIGLYTYFNGIIHTNNAMIKSQSGGTAIHAQSGGQIVADNIKAEIDNSNAKENYSYALHTSNTYLSSNNPSITVRNSLFDIKGDKAAGIASYFTNSEINLLNSTLRVENGPAAVAYNAALTTINLDNSLLSGKTLLEAGKAFAGKDAGADVRGITLNAKNNSVLEGDINIERSKVPDSALTLSSGSSWRGAAHDLENLTLDGNSNWQVTGDSSVDQLKTDGSTIAFDHSKGDFHTLTVQGDYEANNATLVMSLALAGDKSQSDRLHVLGNSSGVSKVQIHNAGGKGDSTLEGIELIKVEGTQNGEFKQDGRIIGGAWEYELVKDANGKWRLVSAPLPVAPGDKGSENGGDNGSDNGGKNGGDNGGVVSPAKPSVKRARPEVGSYIANQAAANAMFTLSASDRPGITEYRDALTGKMEKTTLWLRNGVAHGRFNDSTGQLQSRTNTYVTQLGGDVAQFSLNGSDRFSVGVMAGYGNAKSNTASKVTGYSAKGQINGHSGGIYASWLQDSASKTGAYADSWLTYSRFNNSVKGEGIGQESYKSKGLSASLEGGYTFTFGEQQRFSVQPKMQAIWMGVKTADYVEQNGTHVQATGNNNVQTRTGIRAAMKGHHGNVKNGVNPYVELNWLHNTQQFGSKLDGVKVEQAGARNMGEVKMGIDAQVKNNVGIWGGITQQVGGAGLSNTGANLGVKVSF